MTEKLSDSGSVHGMDRKQAQAAVDSVTVVIGGFKAVSHESALTLLGAHSFALLCDDAIRRLGPKPEFVYPWNVVDYLEMNQLDAPPK